MRLLLQTFDIIGFYHFCSSQNRNDLGITHLCVFNCKILPIICFFNFYSAGNRNDETVINLRLVCLLWNQEEAVVVWEWCFQMNKDTI